MAAEFAKYRILPPAGLELLTPLYDTLCALVGLGRAYRRWLITLAEIDAGHTVLDVGCGTGSLAIDVAALNPRVSVEGIDPSPWALRIAERKARRRAISVTFREARSEALPFASATFVRAICSLTLHHIPDEAKLVALKQIRRVLRPDGLLLLADFETSRSRLFCGKHRSKRPLHDWLEEADFSISSLGIRRGVHVYRAAPMRGIPIRT